MSSSTYRVNYSDYVADITHSPSSTRKLATTGIGHHITTSTTSTGSTRSPVMPHYGGGAEKCVRCLKSVYLAEKKIGAGKPYHNSCFNCKNCRRKLDSATLSEHKGEIYCKSCYTKQYGAHGLISGVSMSTERTTVQETRRSSFATDLDSPMINYQPTRYRANSTDNLVDIPIVIESRRSPSPSVIKKNEIQSFIDSPYRSPDKFSPVSIHEKTPTKDRSRSPSPSAFIPVTTYLPRVEPRMVPMTTNLDSPPTANSPFSTIAALAKPRADADDFDD